MVSLTDLSIRNLAAPERGQKSYAIDPKIPGLTIRVSQGGAKTFTLMVGPKSRRERLTLGRYPTISLADARTVARRLLAERTLGRHQTARIALGDALGLYTEQHVAKLAPSTQKQLQRLFDRYLKRLRPTKLADIKTHDITDITDRCAPSEAEHLHRACNAFFRWCVRRRILQHSPLEGLESPSKWKARDRVLSDGELRAIWRATEQPTTFNAIIRLAAITGQRRGELSQIVPEWVADNVLTFPARVVKNRRPHSIPLSATALELVQRAPLAFSGWSKSKARLDQDSGVTDWVIHDLRRTYVTNLQKLKVSLEVREALVNHISGTKSGIAGVYARHDYWDEMVEAVANYEGWFTVAIS
jgi:integrase